MCAPYNRNPRYYYPGRPYVTAAWLSSLCILPYVFNPESADAWFLVRLYFLPVTLYHFVLILFSYFGSVMQWKKWQGPTLVAGIPLGIALLAALVLAILPGDQIGNEKVETFILHILGLLITGVCFTAVGVVRVWASRFDADDFSNPADFPVVQARMWLVLILVNALLCWTGALLDSPAVMAVIMLLISSTVVLFVITALNPHRSQPRDEEEADVEAEQLYQRAIPKKKKEEMLTAIRTVVEEQKAYQDPHLTLHEVAERCGYNRTYISGLMKSELGGFFVYVNRLRLTYVEEYLKENADASLGEAIEAAGFGSRPSYYAVKTKLEQMD
jgi:AraC-like DNA-binding protein